MAKGGSGFDKQGGRGGASGLSGVSKQKGTQLTQKQISNLKGTKKQVEWATDIINDAYRQVDGIINAHRNSKRQYDSDITKSAQEVKDWITTSVGKVDKASAWIDRRELFDTMHINDRVNKHLRVKEIPVEISLTSNYRKKRR